MAIQDESENGGRAVSLAITIALCLMLAVSLAAAAWLASRHW